MYTEEDLNKDIKQLVAHELKHNFRLDPDVIAREIIASRLDFFANFVVKEFITERVERQLAELQVTPENQARARVNPDLIIPGYERLQKVYLIETTKNWVAMPLDKLSREQIDAQIAELLAIGEGSYIHAEELKLYASKCYNDNYES